MYIVISLFSKQTINKYFHICINMQRSENNTVPAIKREKKKTTLKWLNVIHSLQEMLF